MKDILMISFIHTPSDYSPAGNPNGFQVESDNSALVYFNIEILEAVSSSTVGNYDIYASPDYSVGSHINLSKILSNLVSKEVDNSNVFSKGISKSIFGYKLNITEMGVTTGSTTLEPLSSTITGATTYYTWNGEFDRLSFHSYNQNKHVLNDTVKSNFLTLKPNSYVNDFSTEQLYFINSNQDEVYAVIKTFDSSNALLNTYNEEITDLDDYKMFRIQVSPKKLIDSLEVSFTGVTYYTVHLKDESGNILTEVKRYDYKETECNLEVMNVLWVNSLGGLDCYQFIQPQESMAVARASIKRNPFKMEAGTYTDFSNGIFNSTEEIYDSKSQLSVKAYTRVINDKEVGWLCEMVNSKQLYVELTTGTLIPITLKNDSYQFQRTKYQQGQLNQMNFEFTFPEDIIPSLSSGNISYILNTKFWNERRSGWFSSHTCPTGWYAVPIEYVVEPHTYFSYLSLDDANALADDDVAGHGPVYGDHHGTCSIGVGNEEQTATARKNDCGDGFVGSEVTMVVSPDTFYRETLAEANAAALEYLELNKQEYANDNGECLTGVGNEEQTQDFIRDDCDISTTPCGSAVTYIVPADTYWALTLGEANDLALADIAANGQEYANTHGTCSTSLATITITATIRIETTSGSPDKIYVTAHASANVNANARVSWWLVDDTGTYYHIPNIIIPDGTDESSEYYYGEVEEGTGDLFDVVITAVRPLISECVSYTW